MASVASPVAGRSSARAPAPPSAPPAPVAAVALLAMEEDPFLQPGVELLAQEIMEADLGHQEKVQVQEVEDQVQEVGLQDQGIVRK